MRLRVVVLALTCISQAGCIPGCATERQVELPPRQLVAPAGPYRVDRKASLFGTDATWLPTGTILTPDAAPGSRLYELDPHLPNAPSYRAGGAVAAVLSPDGETLLVLTSGFNRIFDPDTGKRMPSASSEWVFVYDVSAGMPRETQVIPVPNTFGGIAFRPDGARFFVSGGPDDTVHAFACEASGAWHESRSPLSLGHRNAAGLGGLGRNEGPYASGLGVSASGGWVAVANYENDSVTVVDSEAWRVAREIPLVPGNGVPGGEFPSAVVVTGDSRAFVTAQRDREVVEIDLASGRVVRRIRVGGQPARLVADRRGRRLYVANANSDTLSVVDIERGVVSAEIPVTATEGNPAIGFRGSNPNALAFSPDEARLYVTNGGNNSVAIVDVRTAKVIGLMPTGFYPTSIAVANDGATLYVVNAKSAAGPNPAGPWSAPERARLDPYDWGRGNQYPLQLSHGGLLALPTPDPRTLARLTRQVLVNNRFDAARTTPPIFEALHGAVKHVIYVVGENRTYDQILGDLPGADGDRRLTLWGESITPNHHELARTFVTLDRFFDSGGVSGTGWQWSTAARSTDVAEKMVPVEYAERGTHTYDWEGENRGVNVSWPTLAQRRAADPDVPDASHLLPGTADVAAVEGPEEGGRGFLWDAAIAAGLTVRNYGFFCELLRYGLSEKDPAFVPLVAEPFRSKLRVAFPTKASLHERTDPYFRGFDMGFPDVWREAEWEREFDGYVTRGDLPALELVRLPHDHLGAFDEAAAGVNTPDTQIADNDYAIGRLVEKVARSPFWKDTVIVAIEDDAQNGSDHVDAHRSFALFAGGHVRRSARISTSYSTPSVLRTIELLLGIPPLGQTDAFAPPMAELFDTRVDATPFVAKVPPVLRTTKLAVGPGDTLPPRGDAARWARLMRGQNFAWPDALDPGRFNLALTCGLQESTCAALEDGFPPWRPAADGY